MNKEKKLAEFQNATAATIKAIAPKKLKNREIQFFGNDSRINSKQITIAKANSDFDESVVKKTRGESDKISLKLQYHDNQIHSKLKPTSDLASIIFNLAEDTRIESIGSKKFIGIKDNLQNLIEKKFESNLIAPPGSDDTTSFINAMHLYLRKKLSDSSNPEKSEKTMSVWEPWLEKRVGAFISKLSDNIENQEIFAKNMNYLLTAIKSELGDLDDSNNDSDDDSDENSMDEENSDDENNTSQGESEEENEDGIETGIDENTESTAGENEVSDEDLENNEGEGNEELISKQQNNKNQLDNKSDGYKIFTNKYDEIINAIDLCDGDELLRLRKTLDKQLENLQGAVARLANKLQRKLQARQNRTWEFDLEEGMLDAAKLARVVSNPMFPLSYKIEKDTKFKDTIVSILIDNSGSMRGRPITIAAISADILARTLERCGVKVEILGFTTKAWKGGQSREQWINQGKVTNPGRLNDLRHIIYKSADAPWRRSKNSLGLMLREGILKENIDGEALIWAHDRIYYRYEERKILMVISDGAPVDDTTLSANSGNYLEKHLKLVINFIENNSPVELIAIGIGHDVTRYYKKAVTLTDAEHLAGAMTEQLADLFDENI
ncbi:MAG: cobaltochelatase subunit CobT [SAR116 cluster bacterium]|nr:cobaltochelatase subunit CobT [SAR116 cluster bacterium]RPH07599.1 MAG: cobaltochelatase subunit CobT [Alphaproteobacteria bacterium TMED54]